jgi:FAD/FMN-containing dehydrogenase
VATKVIVRVVPTPESVRTLVSFFESPKQAGQAVSAIVSAGVVPGAIEMMDNLTIGASEAMAHAGWPLDAGAALLVELDGPQAELEATFDQVGALCEQAGCSEVRVARDEAERQVFWKMRKAAFPAMGRVSSHYYVQDSVIPRTALGDVLDRIDELSREYDLQVANAFHAGDGNLHPLVCYDGHAEGEAGRAEELAGEIVIACVEAGGSITGEHGVGVDKKRYMPKMFSESDLDALQSLRCAFHTDGLANPSKVMPPRLCGEVPALSRAPAREGGPGGALLMDAAGSRPPARGLGVRVVGGGTKLGWGRDRGAELSLAELDAIVEHNVGDLTAILQAGCPLTTARDAFAAEADARARPARRRRDDRRRHRHRRLGPLRHRYGGPRDLVLGVQVALPDGSLARAGSKVIKNVAGYDLAKLMAAHTELSAWSRRSASPAPRRASG